MENIIAKLAKYTQVSICIYTRFTYWFLQLQGSITLYLPVALHLSIESLIIYTS